MNKLPILPVMGELDAMNTLYQDELINRLRLVLAHLLKWQYQFPRLSQREVQLECICSRNVIAGQRAALRYLLERHPGLMTAVPDSLSASYPQALDLAAVGPGLPVVAFPRDCPFSQSQVLDRDYFPPLG
jgi:hypothetical protein